MREVNITELRSHLHKYLEAVQKGKEIAITWHGKVVAVIVPHKDTKKNAVNRLKELRNHCKIMDVVSPIHETWEADE